MATLQRWTKYDLQDSQLFESKIKIPGNTPANSNTKDVEITVLL